VDQDGDPDLICLEHRQHFEIYLNDGTGKFAKRTTRSGVVKGRLCLLGVRRPRTSITTGRGYSGQRKYFLKILKGTGGGSFQYPMRPGIADVSAAPSMMACVAISVPIIRHRGYLHQRPKALRSIAACPARRIRLIGRAAPGSGGRSRLYTRGGSLVRTGRYYDSQAPPATRTAGHERHFGWAGRTVDVAEFYPSRVLVWKRGVNANETVEIPEPSATEPTRRPQ
jgi:hypothetical protein